jgi:glutaminyl-peptide cyclotransferase
MIKRILSLSLISSALLLQGCSCNDKGKKPAETPVVVTPGVKINVPVFNADSAFYYVSKQVSFGPRVPNSPAHFACGNYLAATLREFSDTVYEQETRIRAFHGVMLNVRNIVAEFNPSAANRVLLMAHWDTRPFADQDSVNINKPIDGANDGGSGVGVLLEIARIMKANYPSIGVDIILFDAEDYGQPENSGFPEQENTYCLGSQYWSKNKHRKDYQAMYGILLDMVGAKNARFVKEGYSAEYAPEVLNKVWRTAQQLGYFNYFIDYKKEPITDDHFWVNTVANIPSIDIIEYDASSPSRTFSHTWHTHGDKLEIIDKSTLKAVGQTLLELIYRVEGGGRPM